MKYKSFFIILKIFSSVALLISNNVNASERIKKINEIEHRFQASSIKEAKTYRNYKIPGTTLEIIPTEDRRGFAKKTKDGKIFIMVYDETLNSSFSTRLVDCKNYTYRTDEPPRTIDEVVKAVAKTYGGALVYAACNLPLGD